MDIEESAYLWDGSQGEWVLVRVYEGEERFIILRWKDNIALIIEDEGEHIAVVHRMKLAGVAILEVDDLKKDK